jgi:hypothetical protein
MYEVIICTVHTGRVERKSFKTREAARRFVDRREAVWARSRDFSLRDYRVEVRFLGAPAAPETRPAVAAALAA